MEQINKQRQAIRIATCVVCGEDKPFAAKGMCRTCYMRQRQGCTPRKPRHRACSVCGEERYIAAQERCRTCYSRLQYARARGKQPDDARRKSAVTSLSNLAQSRHVAEPRGFWLSWVMQTFAHKQSQRLIP